MKLNTKILLILGGTCFLHRIAIAAVAGPKEFRYLKAIPCVGSYNPGGIYTEYLRSLRLKKEVELEDGYVKTERDTLPSFYLGPLKLVAQECSTSDNRCILRGAIPVPIRSYMSDEIVAAINQAMNPERDLVFDSWNGGIMTDRDRGLYDNMTPLFKKLGLLTAKKQIFENMKIRRAATSASPYHAFISSVEQFTGMKITGLLIEVADTINEASLSLGAAVLFSKVDAENDWRLTPSSYRRLISEEKRSSEAKIVECYLDELLGLHLASKIPVVTSQSLYNRVCIDGLLEQNTFEGEPKLFMRAPYFDSERDQRIWANQLEESRVRPSKKVPKISEISDATTFLKMRLSEKRACLRSSGVVALPRPREGPRKVDALMIPLLDEEVAYEVLRRLGETRGDFKVASEMQVGD